MGQIFFDHILKSLGDHAQFLRIALSHCFGEFHHLLEADMRRYIGHVRIDHDFQPGREALLEQLRR